jgi:hypothetical protein
MKIEQAVVSYCRFDTKTTTTNGSVHPHTQSNVVIVVMQIIDIQDFIAGG